MERSKIRPGDHIRTFFVGRFFVDYLLELRVKNVANPSAQETGPTVGHVTEMLEDETMRWVISRMRWSMDERVSFLAVCCHCAERS